MYCICQTQLQFSLSKRSEYHSSFGWGVLRTHRCCQIAVRFTYVYLHWVCRLSFVVLSVCVIKGLPNVCMFNHVHKTTVNSLSLSHTHSLSHCRFSFKGFFGFIPLLPLPTRTPASWQSLTLSIYCTLLHKHPTLRTLSLGVIWGFGWMCAGGGMKRWQKLTHGQLCVWEGFDQSHGEQPSGGGCRMQAVIIEEEAGWGCSLLRHTSTGKNKHLLIYSKPPPSPCHCPLSVHRLSGTSSNMGSATNCSNRLQWFYWRKMLFVIRINFNVYKGKTSRQLEGNNRCIIGL